MQDNESIHTSSEMKVGFDEQSVALLDHPANSPDLNSMENVWGHLVRMIYSNGKQYASVTELKDPIIKNWNLLQQKLIKGLVLSMKNRIKEVLMKKGGFTSY